MKNRIPSEINVGQELSLAAHLQPPMANGEVIFEAPWQGRIFAMAVALSDQGVFVWSEFQQSLIDTIAESNDGLAMDSHEVPFEYYDHVQPALERLLDAKGIVLDQAWEVRKQSFAARPNDHDHLHDR